MYLSTSLSRGIRRLCGVCMRTSQRSHKVLQDSFAVTRRQCLSLSAPRNIVLRDVKKVVPFEDVKESVEYLSKDEREQLLKELQKHTVQEEEAAVKEDPPTKIELWRVFRGAMVPFIAFGFQDNFIMIIAGEWIENMFGVYLGISVIAAAALGNLLSDVLGLASQHKVESWCIKLGFGPPHLTAKQHLMKKTRNTKSLGNVIGIIIGCLLGMVGLYMPIPFKKKDNDSASSTEVTDFSRSEETISTSTLVTNDLSKEVTKSTANIKKSEEEKKAKS